MLIVLSHSQQLLAWRSSRYDKDYIKVSLSTKLRAIVGVSSFFALTANFAFPFRSP